MSQRQQKKEVVDRSNAPDYTAVKIPTKPPEEFTYAERRAELLQLVEQAGHPAALNQSELAERYGVSQQQISKDFDRLDEYVRERIGRRRDLLVDRGFRWCIRTAMEQEDVDAARKALEAYNDYQDSRINTLEFRRRLDRLEEHAERQGGSP